MFIALGASIKGWQHCRPVIIVDGTFLECKRGGSLLCACAKDTENQIFLQAFGIGDSENNDSWDYFFKMLRESYGEREDMWIVSDRHPSIHKGAEKWFPKALLGYCNLYLIRI